MSSPEDGSKRFSRRKWLATTGSGVVAAGLAKTRFDAVDLLAQEVSGPDPTKIPGRLHSEVGMRAPGETLARLPNRQALSASTRSPIHLMDGIITPSDLHFERHHAGIPTIDPDTYELLIHGMVERPMVFRLADLKRYPAVSRICFVECSGNGGFNPSPNENQTLQLADGLLSTSEWIGVPLATLLREVGVRDGASWIVAEGGDAAMLNRSIPMNKAMDDALIAYGQNGEAIRPAQGYPARVLLPGYEGNAQVKWVRRIEVTDQPVMSREETSRYTDPLQGGRARQFSFMMEAKSLITFPSYPAALTEPGWWEIRGLAWSGRGRITRVDISADRGETWAPAELQEPILSKCTARFRHLWNWDGEETFLMSRATDETGYVQPFFQQVIEYRGQGTGYHSNYIRPIRVARDGAATFGLGYFT